VLLRGLLDRARNKTTVKASKAKGLRRKLREVEGRIERLYAALADGTFGDTDMFRRLLAQIEGEREEALRMIAALEKHREVPRHLLTKSNIARFATVARDRLHNENASLREGYMRHSVSRVEVGDREIRISGPHASLADGVGLRQHRCRSAQFCTGLVDQPGSNWALGNSHSHALQATEIALNSAGRRQSRDNARPRVFATDAWI
jgi:hypothetical protein